MTAVCSEPWPQQTCATRSPTSSSASSASTRRTRPATRRAAAELLRDYLEANGVECELIAKTPERANLVARIPGGDGPSLLLLGHTDVVLADPAEWTVPPFSGELRRRRGLGPRRARHEEPGRGERRRDRVARARGLPAERRPDLRGDGRRGAGAATRLRPRVALRGASRRRALRLRDQRGRRRPDRARRTGRPVYQATVAEKMTAPFRLRVHGRSGHASMPRIADNALVNAAQLIERIAAYRPEPQIGPEVEAFLAARCSARCRPRTRPSARVAQLSPGRRARSSTRCSRRPSRRRSSPPRRSGTSSPRSARSRSTAGSCPGQHPEHVEPMIRAVLGGDVDYDLEWIEARGGTRSPLDTPLWQRARGVGGRGRARREGRRRSRASASPTATGCARRSARSRTASSPRAASCRRRSPRRSSTPPTSASRSPISSSASAGCATRRTRCSG